MVYLAIAVISLHFLAFPLAVRARIYIDSDAQTGKITVKLYFIPLYVKKLNFDGLHDALNGVEKKVDEEKRGGKSGFKRAIINFVLATAVRIAKRVRVRALDLRSELGTGDAATTAVAVSSALVLYAQACAFWGISTESGVIKPHYDRAKLFLLFDGIISLCFADIIYAVCAQILSKAAERGKGVPHGKHIVTE